VTPEKLSPERAKQIADAKATAEKLVAWFQHNQTSPEDSYEVLLCCVGMFIAHAIETGEEEPDFDKLMDNATLEIRAYVVDYLARNVASMQ